MITSLIDIAQAYAETPEHELLDVFAKKTSVFYDHKYSFDVQVSNFLKDYNSVISKVEFTRGIPIPQLTILTEVQWELALIDKLNTNIIGIHQEAGILLQKVSELQSIDARLHVISQTNFDNMQYQKLTTHFLQYSTPHWAAIKHSSKTLTQLDNLQHEFF